MIPAGAQVATSLFSIGKPFGSTDDASVRPVVRGGPDFVAPPREQADEQGAQTPHSIGSVIGNRQVFSSLQGYKMRNEVLEFYLLAIASFIETSAPVYGEPLRAVFAADPQFCRWLEKVWLPRKVAHGRQLRALVQKHWPGLDWEEAYLAYFRQVVAGIDQPQATETPASIALGHCLSERKCAMLSAALARVRPLCPQASLLQGISTEALRGCTAFRDAHERFDAWQQNGTIPQALRLHEKTRPGPMEVQRAFAAVQRSWHGNPRQLTGNYQDLRAGVERVLRGLWPIQESRRFMFVPYRPSPIRDETSYRAEVLTTLGGLQNIASQAA